MRFRAILFDAYGTLLDVLSVGRLAESYFPEAGAALTVLWREKQLQYSWLRTLSGRYADFWDVTGDALDYAAARLGLSMTAGVRAALCNEYLRLAAYDDAAPCLAALGTTPLAVLSNGTPHMLEAAFTHLQLRQHFAALLSVDAARQFKTAPAAYQLATDAFGGSPGEFLMVSSNGWDIAGAAHFGFLTFWVNRLGAPVEQLGIEPSAIGRSLADLPVWLADQTPT